MSTLVFLISSYELALHISLIGPDSVVNNYDFIITNSINSLLIGSRCNPNGTYINHC